MKTGRETHRIFHCHYDWVSKAAPIGTVAYVRCPVCDKPVHFVDFAMDELHEVKVIVGKDDIEFENPATECDATHGNNT